MEIIYAQKKTPIIWWRCWGPSLCTVHYVGLCNQCERVLGSLIVHCALRWAVQPVREGGGVLHCARRITLGCTTGARGCWSPSFCTVHYVGLCNRCERVLESFIVHCALRWAVQPMREGAGVLHYALCITFGCATIARSYHNQNESFLSCNWQPFDESFVYTE